MEFALIKMTCFSEGQGQDQELERGPAVTESPHQASSATTDHNLYYLASFYSTWIQTLDSTQSFTQCRPCQKEPLSPGAICAKP